VTAAWSRLTVADVKGQIVRIVTSDRDAFLQLVFLSRSGKVQPDVPRAWPEGYVRVTPLTSDREGSSASIQGTASLRVNGIVHERDGRLRAIDHGWWKNSRLRAAGGKAEEDLRRPWPSSSRVHHPDAVAIRGVVSSAPTPRHRTLPSGRHAGAVMGRGPLAAGVEVR